MLSVLDRHTDISTVMVNGLPSEMLFGQCGPLPGVVRALIEGGHTCLEVLFPIRRGRVEEYPYRESLEAVRYLHDRCGPEHLVSGSDLPNVLRHCTYAQTLEYLRRHADFISAAGMDLILGSNLLRLFGDPSV